MTKLQRCSVIAALRRPIIPPQSTPERDKEHHLACFPKQLVTTADVNSNVHFFRNEVGAGFSGLQTCPEALALNHEKIFFCWLLTFVLLKHGDDFSVFSNHKVLRGQSKKKNVG